MDGAYRLTHRGEAPTTVEAPFEDVTRGVLNAIMELEELSGRKILNDESIISPTQDESGVDIYISTSSAGGGLQMGQVIGQSDKTASSPASDLVTNNMLLGTVMHTLFALPNLRLRNNFPADIQRVITTANPLPQLV